MKRNLDGCGIVKREGAGVRKEGLEEGEAVRKPRGHLWGRNRMENTPAPLFWQPTSSDSSFPSLWVSGAQKAEQLHLPLL